MDYYQSAYQLHRYHKIIKEAKEKLGDKCAQCGSTDNLEFDHIDPTIKSFVITEEWGCSEKVFNEELDKCQLLCKEHHILKSIKEAGKLPAKNTNNRHGTLSMYRYCKCELCVAEHTKYCREWKRNNKNK